MIKSTRYTKGAGNAALGLRLVKLGQYWNFTTQAAVYSESADTRVLLTEYPNSGDAAESYYSVTFTPPAGAVWDVEIVEISSGATIATGDTDALVSDVLSAMSSIGVLTGTYNVSVQFYVTSTATPIADIRFDVYNAAGTLKLNGVPFLSDTLGQASFLRDSGMYQIRAIKAGYTIAVGTVIVTNADVALIMYGNTTVIPSPGAADACMVALYCFMPDSVTPMPTVDAKATIVKLPYNYNGKYHSGKVITGTYDSGTGLLTFELVWGAEVDFDIRYISPDTMHRTIPSVATVMFQDIPG